MKQEYSLIESQIAELEKMQNMLITENENLKRKLLVNTSGQSGIAENKVILKGAYFFEHLNGQIRNKS